MGKFNFDERVDRAGDGQTKWNPEVLRKSFGRSDLLPLWVADMDFRAAPAIRRAVERAAEHGIYGYTSASETFFEAYRGFYGRHHGWAPPREWLRFLPGVVPAINQLIQAFSEPGDEVLLLTPVYYPFMSAIQNQGRRQVNSSLLYQDKTYAIDFDDFERKAASARCKIFVMSNPHNPVGRVFTREELRRLGDICLSHGVFVISDEVHCDLTAPGYTHTVFADVDRRFADNCAICHAPSKTFNIAGLQTSVITVPSKERRERFAKISARFSADFPNCFGMAAAIAAWEQSDDWLCEMKAYIAGNLQFIEEFAAQRWAGRVDAVHTEGTYLAWLDFRGVEPDADKLERLMIDEAGVALDEGTIFGEEGRGFERINAACPRSVLEECLVAIDRHVVNRN